MGNLCSMDACSKIRENLIVEEEKKIEEIDYSTIAIKKKKKKNKKLDTIYENAPLKDSL